MPHDCKGRRIEVNDHLKFLAWDNASRKLKPTIGRVAHVMPGATTCNVSACYLLPGYMPVQMLTVNAHETEIVLKGDGSEPALPDVQPVRDTADPVPA